MTRGMFAAVAALCCTVFADGPEGAPRPEKARRAMRPAGFQDGAAPMMAGMNPILRMVSNPAVAEKIGLTDAQKAKIKEFGEAARNGRGDQKKVREATMKQVELMKADKIDEAAVMAAIDEVFELRKAMAKAQAKRVIAMKSILTPEQVAKAREEMKKMFESRNERGARRPVVRGDRGAPQPEAK